MSQPDCDVVLASNFADCSTIANNVRNISQLLMVDTTKITSNRTLLFANKSTSIFQSDRSNELWTTSALRFFIMEDLMLSFNYTEMMHIEADNLLFGQLTSILDVLKKGYPLAATPLNANKSFITASVLWIGSLHAIIQFNDFLLALGMQIDESWKSYLKWLRQFACCRHGGVDPDEHGKGIKPFAINEMSMLAYYHELYPQSLKLLPVVPVHNYVLNRFVCNMSEFGPGGTEVGPDTGLGIWDANSWGQHIGGTSHAKGRDIGFSDPTHISGQAMRMSGCRVHMLCGNQSYTKHHSHYMTAISNFKEEFARSGVVAVASLAICYTAPFVSCGGGTDWTPLWNLHVHSKHTEKFRSVLCNCG